MTQDATVTIKITTECHKGFVTILHVTLGSFCLFLIFVVVGSSCRRYRRYLGKNLHHMSEHPSKWWKMFDVHSTILELLQHRCTQGESAAETKVAEASCWWCKQSCVWLWFFIEVFQQFGQVPVPYDCMYSMSVFWIFYTILQLFHMLRAFALVLEVNSSLLVIADSIYH